MELRACRAAPAANKRSAARITGRRPKASARTEAKGEAKSARSDVLDVMRDLSREVRRREEREGPMETSVAEITPVSSVFGGDIWVSGFLLYMPTTYIYVCVCVCVCVCVYVCMCVCVSEWERLRILKKRGSLASE